MKAVVYEEFAGKPSIQQVADPSAKPDGVVIEVQASGVCRSDWHGWLGHDADIELPHVPGHEFAGIVLETGDQVSRFHKGDRITVPFINSCGSCPECHSGNHQVCHNQGQPGFNQWGSFAQYVSVDYADVNLVHLPEYIDFTTAASLGCRFATAFRAVMDQGKVSGGEWIAVHGCGGVGLSAVMIASAAGAQVIAIDINEDQLSLAKSLGADVTLNANDSADIAAEVVDITAGGAHVSVDALGHPITCVNSVRSLKRRGKHIQVGLLLADQVHPPIPMDRVVAWELEVIGSHGMQAYRYDAMLAMIESGQLEPRKLLGQTISLEQSIEAMTSMDQFDSTGVTVITEF